MHCYLRYFIDVSGQGYDLATLFLGKVSGFHWIGGWVGLRNGMDRLQDRNISCLGQESNQDPSDIQPIA
jgi:hypothetical protein